MLRALVALALIVPLSGCAAVMAGAILANGGRPSGMGEFTFPAAMLVALPDGREELLTGTLEERVDGRAEYALTGPTWGTCTGAEAGGRNTLRCSGGQVLAFRTPLEGPKMSAAHVVETTLDGQPVRLVLTWDDRGNERTARAALAEG